MDVIPLQNLCAEPIGAQFITGKDEAFVVPSDYVRRRGIRTSQLKAYGTGEDVRDWHARPTEYIVFPYDAELPPLKEPLPSGLDSHLRSYKVALENCIISSSIKKRETNLKWFEFRRCFLRGPIQRTHLAVTALPIRLVVNPGLQAALDVHCSCRWVDPPRSHEDQRGNRPQKPQADDNPSKKRSKGDFFKSALRVCVRHRGEISE